MIQNEPKVDPFSHAPDRRKNVGSNELFEHFLEFFDYDPALETILSNADLVVNLFAGNFNESVVFFEKLAKEGNNHCTIIAVDKTPPHSTEGTKRIIALGKNDFFKFRQEDVFDYLKTAPTNSTDILTAFGAEYVFAEYNASGKLLEDFAVEARRLLKPGGVLIAPGVGDNRFWIKRGFRFLGEGIVQKPA